MLKDKNLLLRYLFIVGGIAFTLISARDIPVERFFLLCLIYLLNAQFRVILLQGRAVLLSLFLELAIVALLWRQFGGMTNLFLYVTLYDAMLLTGVERYSLVLLTGGLQAYLLLGSGTDLFLLNLLFFFFTLFTALRLGQMDREVQNSEGLYDAVRRYSYELEDARKRLEDYAKKVEDVAQLEERNRLSGEIHDTIGHQLTGILMQLEATIRIHSVDAARGREMLPAVRDNLRECIELLRRTVKNLKPSDTPGPANSLPDLVADFARRTGVNISFSTIGRPYKLYPSAEIVFYQNAQEALTNAIRHGPARNIRVTLEYGATKTAMTVADDGPGCARIRPGLGFRGMEERVRLAEGELVLDGSEGFTVRTVLPRRGD